MNHFQTLFFGKKSAFLSTLGFAFVSMWVPTLAFADAYVTLSSFSGTPGSTLTVLGGGWTAHTPISIFLNGALVPALTVTTDDLTNFSTTVTVPANTPQGPFSVDARDTTGHRDAFNSFYVIPLTPSATFITLSHAPFASVSVNATGFAPNEDISIELGGSTSSAHADSSGNATGTILVPQVSSGLYHINVTGVSSGVSIASYLNYFWIDGFYPTASPSSYYIVPGGVLSFTGSGFAPHETVTVTETGSARVLSTFTTDSSGSFNAQGGFALPAAFHGATKDFTLTGSLSQVSTHTGMTVGDFYPYASPSSYYLSPGATLSFTGGGFAAGEVIDVSVLGSTTVVAHITTGSTGSFLNNGSVTIPFSAAGSTISYQLLGETSHASASASTGIGSFYPSITPSEYYVVPNSTIVISGSGFAPLETVSLSVGSSATITTTADANGKISSSLLIPINTVNPTITVTGSMSHASASVGVTLATFYPSVTPSAYYIFPGSGLSFTGSGFAPHEIITRISNSLATTTVTANSFGMFSFPTTTVPFSALGTLNTTFIGSLSSTQVTSSISVGSLSPYLSSDLYSAGQGQTVHVTGTSFGAGEMVHVTAGGSSVNTIADASGQTPAVALTTPFGVSTMHVVFTGVSTGAHGSLDIGLTSFTPQVSPSAYYTSAGVPLTFTGSGFAPHEQVTVGLNGSPIPPVVVSSTGTFTYMYTPSYTGNTAQFVFTGATSQASQSLSITLAPLSAFITLSTYYAQSGSPLTISGSGFAPLETVQLSTIGGSVFATVTANASGAFTSVGIVPYAPAGNESLIAVGQGSGVIAGTSLTVAPVYPTLTLGSYASAPGTAVTFIGSGFLPNEPIRITTDRTGSTVLSVFNADTSGSFTNSGFIIPNNFTQGNLSLTITGAHSFASKTITYYVTGI